MAELSIIVPVYNVEEYLRRCIESIIGQTFEDFELILVDDGSTDKSGEICDEYSAMDSRIKVIHKKNEGISSARNRGMQSINGDYIMFVDSDDSLVDNMIQEILKKIKENSADIMQYSFNKIYIDDKRKNNYGINKIEKGDRNFALNIVINDPFSNVVWNKIYKRSIVQDIVFDESYKRFEDVMFTCQAILKSRVYLYTEEKLYNYLIRKDSLCRAKEYTLELLESLKCQRDRLKDLYEDGVVDGEIIISAEKRYYNDMIRHYSLVDKNLKNDDREKGFDTLDHYLKEFYKQSNKNIKFKKRIIIKSLLLNRSLYFAIRNINVSIKYVKEGIKYRLAK